MRKGQLINQGISWAGTSDEDAAYRTSTSNPMAEGGAFQGFNLSQWFTDQGIEGDHSYYRYAKIRSLSDEQFRAGAGGSQLDQGNAYGLQGLSQLYSYAGTYGADTNKVAAQNINSLTSQGLDSWGRPLPAGFKTAAAAEAKRLAGITGGYTGTVEGTGAGMLGAGSQISPEFSLSEEETLGKV